MRITLQHIRAYQKFPFCSQGIRNVANRFGVDWDKFLKEGIDSSQLKHIPDAQLQDAIKWIEENCDG